MIHVPIARCGDPELAFAQQVEQADDEPPVAAEMNVIAASAASTGPWLMYREGSSDHRRSPSPSASPQPSLVSFAPLAAARRSPAAWPAEPRRLLPLRATTSARLLRPAVSRHTH